MVKVVKKNGDPLFKTITPRTRLKFSIGVIAVNFILGVVGMILGSDLTALGVYLGLANAPLYAYVLGQSFRPTQIPEEYYKQQHGGAGGLGSIIGNQNQHQGGDINIGGSVVGGVNMGDGSGDAYNIPQNLATTTTKPIKTTKKDASEIG